MTGTLGWVYHPQGRPHQTPLLSKRHIGWPRLPDDAPDILRRNTITISDPDRILVITEGRRQHQFQTLVKCYKKQLVDGCCNSSCTTPTCFAYRRRVTKGPLRKLTALSARTVACYLATQDDPEAGLCPHLLHKRADGISAKSASGQTEEDKAGLGSQDATQAKDDGASRQPALDNGNGHASASLSAGTPSSKEEGSSSRLAGGALKKDEKSFTQNLFDTLPLRMLEWWAPHFRARPPIRTQPKAGFSKSASSIARECPSSSAKPSRVKHNVRDAGHAHGESVTGSDGNQSSQASAPAEDHVKDPQTRLKGLLPRPQNAHSAPASSQQQHLPTNPPPEPRGEALDQVGAHQLSSQGVIVKPGSDHPAPIRPATDDELHTSTTQNPPREAEISTDFEDSAELQGALQGVDGLASTKRFPASPSQNENDPLNPTSRTETTVHETTRVGVEAFKSPQSLSYLSSELVNALVQLITAADDKPQAQQDLRRYFERQPANDMGMLDRARRLRSAYVHSFAEQSIYYVLSSPHTLLSSFRMSTSEDRDQSAAAQETLLPDYDTVASFRSLASYNSSLVFHSLWCGIETLFTPPPQLRPPRSCRKPVGLSNSAADASSSGSPTNGALSAPERYLTDSEASHLILLCFHALVAFVPPAMNMIGYAIPRWRAYGKVGIDTVAQDKALVRASGDVMRCIDAFEDEMALRLACRLIRGVAARLHFSQLLKARSASAESKVTDKDAGLSQRLCEYLVACCPQVLRQRGYFNVDARNAERAERGRFYYALPWAMPAVLVEWIRTLLLKFWDGKEEVSRFGIVGSALSVLSCFYEHRESLGLDAEMFEMPYFYEKLDALTAPVDWLAAAPNNKSAHLLSYPFLFPSAALVTYFRAMNLSSMSRAFDASEMNLRLLVSLAALDPAERPEHKLIYRLKSSISTYLVLEVRREMVLEDALDEVWRRERQELMRPLKVRMGMHEGEEGTDHGGVQQEFFRVCMSQALDPNFGLFTTDAETRMAWFLPCSLEPLHRFEQMGLLVSIAIYNGITLPFTFPLAFYRKLLGLPVTELSHIRDGWPVLARGLSELLNWNQGPVEDVFVRSYVFSFETYGTVVDVDLTRVGRDDPWPTTQPGCNILPPGSADYHGSSDDGRGSQLQGVSVIASNSLGQSAPGPPAGRTEAPNAGLVTNDNREQYVADYIFWLTEKSIQPQFEAFAKGFFTFLSRKAISIFTPQALQVLMQGLPEIDVDALEESARYEDGFSAEHPLIREFWAIVHAYTQQERRQLLEFVTASDRVPVGGFGSSPFIIQRNGPDSSRLPTSLTCFGRLLLPAYSSGAKLREKLGTALKHSKGFGVP